MVRLKTGDKAPEINALDEAGNAVKLADFKDKKLILFFYPKANTETCTVEACNLRDHYQELVEKGFAIIGVSADHAKEQKSFIRKYKLPFPLIPDTDKSIIAKYGVWGPKKMMGREYEGIIRTTFVISEKGTIEKIFEKVTSATHAEQILRVYNL
jgi:peroxiredoxin Q/BCP